MTKNTKTTTTTSNDLARLQVNDLLYNSEGDELMVISVSPERRGAHNKLVEKQVVVLPSVGFGRAYQYKISELEELGFYAERK